MTKRLILNDPERICQWTASRIGCSPWEPDYSGAVGLEKDGEVVIGVVVDNYIPNGAASLHCAISDKRALDRRFLRAVFHWLFVDLELKVLINKVAGSNADSLRFTEHIGYTEFARFPLAWYGQDDLVLFEMRRETCRWLGENNHGK